MAPPRVYEDWLEKVRRDGGELAWIRSQKDFPESTASKYSRQYVIKFVMNQLSVKNAIRSVAEETARSEEELRKEALEILDEMAHSFGMTSTQIVGYVVIKALMRIFKQINVNLSAMPQIRELSKRNPIVFIPTHRTYVDFLLMSLLCYDQNITLPAICAGADFLSSKYVGETLRLCGAYFIRRSFGSNRLYWTLFSEYVQFHITHNSHPTEFFVEGQRSRTSKSLYPRFGLLQVIAEPFLRSQVYDTVVVPVTINYDKLLETFLYGRELLGTPKPKESVSGLLKVRQILNQNFGSVYVTFAEPISLRQYFGNIDRAFISFRPTAHYVYEKNVKLTVATLAHEVVHIHNENNMLTVWPLAASIILDELCNEKTANIDVIRSRLVDLVAICNRLGISIMLNGTVEESISYYLNMYDDLLKEDNGKLLVVDTAEEDSPLSQAVPYVILGNCANPAAYAFSQYAFLLFALNDEHANPAEKFSNFMQLFDKEFVYRPGSEGTLFEEKLNTLHLAKIIQREDNKIVTVDESAVTIIMKIIQPFFEAYDNIISIVEKKQSLPFNRIVPLCQKELLKKIHDGSAVRYSHLSSDLIKNAASVVVEKKAHVSTINRARQHLTTPNARI